jgi:23S rRNA (cytosine1962-C5)-methyltransferase
MSLVLQPAGEVIVRDKALKSIAGRHPWLFSGAIDKATPGLTAGAVVNVLDGHGKFMGSGFFNSNSQITVRMLTFDSAPVDEALIQHRILEAIKLRRTLPEHDLSNAWRLLYGESDGLPGLVADSYADYAVVHFHSAGWESFREDMARMLMEAASLRGVYDGSDAAMREREGLSASHGELCGETVPDFLEASEFGRKFVVDVRKGQKSGLYLDQKFNHQAVRSLASGKRALDCFAYTGGFGLAALEGGCLSLTAVEISDAAVAALEQNLQSNGFADRDITIIEADAFEVLRTMVSDGERFDLVVLDPPAFCKSKTALIQACRGYKDINRLAMQLIDPGGILVSCSCSRPVSDDLFLKVLWEASVEAGRAAKLLNLSGQAPDHPVLLSFPESKYLKCATLLIG